MYYSTCIEFFLFTVHAFSEVCPSIIKIAVWNEKAFFKLVTSFCGSCELLNEMCWLYAGKCWKPGMRHILYCHIKSWTKAKVKGALRINVLNLMQTLFCCIIWLLCKHFLIRVILALVITWRSVWQLQIKQPETASDTSELFVEAGNLLLILSQ